MMKILNSSFAVSTGGFVSIDGMKCLSANFNKDNFLGKSTMQIYLEYLQMIREFSEI